MKAVGYRRSLPVNDTDCLLDIDLPKPVATGRDLLVKVEATAVNPVDYKIRRKVAPLDGEYKVIGWDAVGEVVETGLSVSRFKPGDRVWRAAK